LVSWKEWLDIGAGREVMHRANVLAEKQVQRPVEGDASLLVQARQFAQVNSVVTDRLAAEQDRADLGFQSLDNSSGRDASQIGFA